MSNYVATATEALKTAGYRMTSQRRAVLEILSAARAPLTPADLHDRVRQRGKSVDLVSVYRILETLEQNGLVHHILANNSFKACAHYQDRHEHAHGADDGEHCHHLAICTGCGRSFEFECPQLDEIAARVSRESGIRIQRHLLEFQGLCKSCKAA